MHNHTLHISGSRSLTYIASSSLDVSLGCCGDEKHLCQLKLRHVEIPIN